jgi:hypothetical protein
MTSKTYFAWMKHLQAIEETQENVAASRENRENERPNNFC